MATTVAKFAHRIADHFCSMADIGKTVNLYQRTILWLDYFVTADILRVRVSGSKAEADDKGALDTAVSPDDCLQRRNELVSSFVAGFVALLKKRDPEVCFHNL